MGQTFIRETGATQTPVLHDKIVFRDSLKNTVFDRMGLMGKPNSGKPIVVDTNLKGKAGEQVKFHFVPFADAAPIYGQDTSVEGNESKFDEFIDTVTVDTVNFAFRKKGEMTSQRSMLNLENEMRMQIANSFAQYNDKELFKRLSGVALTEALATYTSASNTTDRVAGSNRCIRASGSNGYAAVLDTASDNDALEAALTSADTNSPKLWMRAQVVARTQTATTAPYRLQSIRSSNGKEWFIGLMSPEAAFDLKLHPDWFVRSVAVTESGLDRDPFATGALGTIGNVVLHEAEHVLTFDSDTAGEKYSRNLLLGQNAAVLAFAQTMKTVRKTFDYDADVGIKGVQIRGEAKLQFENKDDSSDTVDFGVLQVITAAN